MSDIDPLVKKYHAAYVPDALTPTEQRRGHFVTEHLLEAIANKDLDMVTALLEEGADPNAEYDGASVYDHACRHNVGNAIRFALIQAGCSDKATKWALGACIRDDRTELFELLIERGAYLDYPPTVHHSWRPPLFLAAQEGKLPYVKRLLEAGASPDSGYHSETALLTALMGHTLTVSQLNSYRSARRHSPEP